MSPLGDALDGRPDPEPRGAAASIAPPVGAPGGPTPYSALPGAAYLPSGHPGLDLLRPVPLGGSTVVVGSATAEPGEFAVDVALAACLQSSHARPVLCLVGLSRRATSSAVARIRAQGCLDRCVVVAAPGDTPPAEQFLAPFAALQAAKQLCSEGASAVLVLDDVTAHAELAGRLHPGSDPVDASCLHALAGAASTSPADRGSRAGLTVLASCRLPEAAPDDEAGRLAALVDAATAHFDRVLRLSSGLRAAGVAPPVADLASGGFAAGASAGMGALGYRLSRLAGETRGGAESAARGGAMGLTPEVEGDASRALYCRLRLLLTPDRGHWHEASQVSPRGGGAEATNRLAARMAREAALEAAGGTRASRDVSGIAFVAPAAAAGGAASPASASRLSAAQSAALGAVRARRSRPSGSAAPRVATGPRQPDGAAARVDTPGHDDAAAGSRRAIASACGPAPDAEAPWPHGPGAASSAALDAFVLLNGYASLVPLSRLGDLRARLHDAAANTPAGDLPPDLGDDAAAAAAAPDAPSLLDCLPRMLASPAALGPVAPSADAIRDFERSGARSGARGRRVVTLPPWAEASSGLSRALHKAAVATVQGIVDEPVARG